MPIITHFIGIYKLWHEFFVHIPKSSRYTLGEKIDSLFIETAELIFAAGYVSKDKKLPYLQKAATKMDLLKFFLQVAWEIGALDNKKYAMVSEPINESGKMLGGWLKKMNPPKAAEA